MIRVNVYTHDRTHWRTGKAITKLVLAYTRYQGEGACVHEVEASTGNAAKRTAIREHRERCLGKQPEAPPIPPARQDPGTEIREFGR